VRKVDKEPAKVSLRHCLIESLDMPGRTMVSHVADPSMLGSLKEGHSIRSAADGVNGAPTVMRWEPVNRP
jgi:Cu/Ag efflux protein CusF